MNSVALSPVAFYFCWISPEKVRHQLLAQSAERKGDTFKNSTPETSRTYISVLYINSVSACRKAAKIKRGRHVTRNIRLVKSRIIIWIFEHPTLSSNSRINVIIDCQLRELTLTSQFASWSKVHETSRFLWWEMRF